MEDGGGTSPGGAPSMKAEIASILFEAILGVAIDLLKEKEGGRALLDAGAVCRVGDVNGDIWKSEAS